MKTIRVLVVLTILSSALLEGLSVMAEAANDSELTAHVILPPGKPRAATILFLYANPKPETPVTARQPNLPKPMQSDAQGDFKFSSLDPRWLYHVIIVAPGCHPAIFDRADTASATLTARLEIIPADAPADTVLHGRVLDNSHRPVAGALIRMSEVTRNGVMHFSYEDLDPYSVSDEDGNFVVHGKTPFRDAGGSARASDFAAGLFEGWSPGETNHELTLIEGATLRGRLLDKGKPVAHAEILVDRFGAEAGSYMWNDSTITDGQGRFLFTHLPPDRNCRLHGRTGSLGNLGAVPTRVVQVHQNGSTNDIGDLSLEPTFTVNGQIHLTDDKPIPTNSYLYFGNFDVGMSSLFEINKAGDFHITGLTAGKATIYLRVHGYQLTPRDSLLIGGTMTNITIGADITGLNIDLRPWTRPAPGQ